MSEIEKMYENAGVKKQYDYIVIKENYNGKIGYTKRAVLEKVEQFKNKTLRIIEVCPFYPDFTAEKQIELICFLLNADIKIDICKEPNMKMEICDIAEALAEVTNTIWQDLTEEEKQQVKGILE